MNSVSLARAMPGVALVAFSFALAACDRTAPPLAFKVITPNRTSAVLLPALFNSVSTPAPAALTPSSGTARPVPTATGISTVAAGASRTPFATPAQTFAYVVQVDDTLEGIAARFKTSVEMLILLNNLQDAQVVAGQQLLIPGAPPTATSTPRPPTATKRPAERTYVVRSGDSLSLIARRYGTTVTILMRYNGLRSEIIVPGQVLRIP